MWAGTPGVHGCLFRKNSSQEARPRILSTGLGRERGGTAGCCPSAQPLAWPLRACATEPRNLGETQGAQGHQHGTGTWPWAEAGCFPFREGAAPRGFLSFWIILWELYLPGNTLHLPPPRAVAPPPALEALKQLRQVSPQRRIGGKRQGPSSQAQVRSFLPRSWGRQKAPSGEFLFVRPFS